MTRFKQAWALLLYNRKQLVYLFLVLIGLAATVFLVGLRQELRGRAAVVEGQTLIVCAADSGDPDCQYFGAAGIQQAVDAGGEADTVLIKNGTYANVKLRIGYEGHPAKTNLTIRGESREQTILIGENFAPLFIIGGESSGITVSSLKITKGGISMILFDNAQAAISGNTFSEHQNGGIHLRDSNQATISGNTFSQNGSEGNSGFGAIRIEGSTVAVIEDNLIIDNSSRGIHVFGNSQATISGNIIKNNMHEGISILGSAQATISRNTLSDNNYGIHLSESGQATISGNTLSEHRADSIWVSNSAGAVIENNLINANTTLYNGNPMYQENAITVRDSAQATITGNVLNGLKVGGSDAIVLGASLNASSRSDISHNTIYGWGAFGINMMTCNNYNTHPAAVVKNNIVVNNGLYNTEYGFGIMGGGCAQRANEFDDQIVAYNLTFANETEGAECGYREFCNSIHEDPMFVNAAGGDFHLQPGSPACAGGENGTHIGAFGCGGAVLPTPSRRPLRPRLRR